MILAALYHWTPAQVEELDAGFVDELLAFNRGNARAENEHLEKMRKAMQGG